MKCMRAECVALFLFTVTVSQGSEIRRFSVVEQEEMSTAWAGVVASEARHLNLSDPGIDSRCRDLAAVESRIIRWKGEHCEGARPVTGTEAVANECGDYRFECANPDKLKSLACYYLFKRGERERMATSLRERDGTGFNGRIGKRDPAHFYLEPKL